MVYFFHCERQVKKMEQVIYADILFLIDISMDFLALYVTARIMKTRFSSGLCVLAATIGAVYSVFNVILRGENIFISFLVSVIICFVAFFGNPISLILKTLFIFYGVSMLLGGFMTLIYNLFNKLTDSNKELLIYGQINTVSESMPIAVFYIGFFLIFILIKIVFSILERRPSKALNHLCVTFGTRSAEFKVAEDSGNRLCEPISGEPIIFIKESSLKRVVGEKTLSALKMGSEFYNGSQRHRYRIVIFNTVSGSDMCVCMKADKLSLNKKLCSAWIAIGKNLKTDGVDGIVSSSLLN